MVHKISGRMIRVGFIAIVFAAGFMCGSISHDRADAQLGDLGKAAMEKAGDSGGAMGSAVKLGEAIVDMQKNVDSLQKNIDVLKTVKSSLGG